MINIKNRYLIAIATIIAIAAVMIGIPAFLMFVDAACSPISNTICMQWRDFQWETVLAGSLGLAGGLSVIISTKMMISHEREHSIQIAVDQNIFAYLDIAAESRRYLALAKVLTGRSNVDRTKHNPESYADNVIEIINTQDQLKTIENYRNRLMEYVQNTQIPFAFADELDGLIDNMGMFDELPHDPSGKGAVEQFEESLVRFESALMRYREKLIEVRNI